MDPEKLFTRVLDDMVRAGWLHSHIFTDGKGHHLVWSIKGIPRGIFIKGIAEDFGLDQGDGAPLAFDVFCQSGTLPAGAEGTIEIDPKVADFWRISIGELGYSGNEDLLLGLVHVCVGWAVDEDTQVQIGS